MNTVLKEDDRQILSSLPNMLRALLQNPDLAINPWFANLLATVADDWAKICLFYNQGNDTCYNLNRCGKMIRCIRFACKYQNKRFYMYTNDTPMMSDDAPEFHPDWYSVLLDVLYIGRIVHFEFMHNTELSRHTDYLNTSEETTEDLPEFNWQDKSEIEGTNIINYAI